MYAFLDNVTIGITVFATIVIMLVVCVPMNNRPLLEKVFVLCIAISTLGASLDRFSRILEDYDPNGEVRAVAMLIVTFSRIGIVIAGLGCVARFMMQKKESAQEVMRLSERLDTKHQHLEQPIAAIS